jgi:hypothetical protein
MKSDHDVAGGRQEAAVVAVERITVRVTEGKPERVVSAEGKGIGAGIGAVVAAEGGIDRRACAGHRRRKHSGQRRCRPVVVVRVARRRCGSGRILKACRLVQRHARADGNFQLGCHVASPSWVDAFSFVAP